jgi:hypothetical protein
MSNIAVRNVLGIDAFAIPRTQEDLEKTKIEWEKILKTINGLTYKEAYVLVLNSPNITESLHLNCGKFRFNKTIRPDPVEIKKIRALISDALFEHPGIISFDMIEIHMFQTQIMDRESRRRKFLSMSRRLKRLRWERERKTKPSQGLTAKEAYSGLRIQSRTGCRRRDNDA